MEQDDKGLRAAQRQVIKPPPLSPAQMQAAQAVQAETVAADAAAGPGSSQRLQRRATPPAQVIPNVNVDVGMGMGMGMRSQQQQQRPFSPGSPVAPWAPPQSPAFDLPTRADNEEMAEGAETMPEGEEAMAEGAQAMPEGAEAMPEGAQAMAEGGEAMPEGGVNDKDDGRQCSHGDAPPKEPQLLADPSDSTLDDLVVVTSPSIDPQTSSPAPGEVTAMATATEEVRRTH
jgi:hypothetical protein